MKSIIMILLICCTYSVQAQDIEELCKAKPLFPLDPSVSMSFGDQSPWLYNDKWLEDVLTFCSISTDESKKKIEKLLQEYLPTDIHKGMALLSLNIQKADVLMLSCPKVNWKRAKQEYLMYRDSVLCIKEEYASQHSKSFNLQFSPTNTIFRYHYLFYNDSLENTVGYCHDVQMGYGDKVFVKEFGSLVLVSVQGDGNISVYMGDKKDLRSGDLGFVSCDGVWREYFPAGVDWYGSKKKFLLERIFFGTISHQEDWLVPVFEYWDPFRDIPENRISNGNLCGCWTPIDLPD